MTKRTKKRIVLGASVSSICLLLTGGFYIRFPRGPAPDCIRALDGAFHEWAVQQGPISNYPNTNGNGSASLAMIKPYFGDGLQRYGYIPGLRFDDSGSLVLMYLKEKTRYSWHGDTTANTFSPKRWKIISPAMIDSGPDPEGGELVDTPEFRRRIQKTLDFLKANQRPNWPAVVAEQTEFLNSIKE